MKHFRINKHLRRAIILSALFFLTFLILPSCNSCACEEDSLDAIKAFKPENKYFKSTLVSLHFMMETSPVAEVDSFFRQLILRYGLPVTPQGAKDGSYTGTTPLDAFDYRHEVKLRIQDGLIVELDYNELKADGSGKQEDEKYCEEMSVTGTTPAIAYPHMEEMLLATQNMMEVDAVSGASYSLQRFRLAVTLALMQASL